MTNKEIVSKLQELGHDVRYYIRKDGSLRITQIDSMKYSARLSDGNKAGRKLVKDQTKNYYTKEDISLYESGNAQRAAARAIRKSGDTFKSQPVKFQEKFLQLQREIRKANRKLAKEGKKKLSVPTWTHTRMSASAAGIDYEKQYNRLEDYYMPLTSGIAPVVMVDALIYKCKMFESKDPEIRPVRVFLEEHKKRIDVYVLKTVRNWVYGVASDVRQSMTAQDVINLMQQTLH